MTGLPTPPSRQLLHNRNIQLACYEREDGLFDVEGHLVDTKPFDLVITGARRKNAGDPIHDMWLRFTFDETMTIVDADGVMDVPAHHSCVGAIPSYKALVGVRIGPGWVRESLKRINRSEGCTHMSEMFTEIGTTAMQAMFGRANRNARLGKTAKSPSSKSLENTCFGWRSDGEIATSARERAKA
jgi:hypothetical protein